ncbi:MAG: MBL fold metallo-hydrolase [Candidatus Dormibacteraeota bacterium]|nr:MBL fold metallo-hydrolase [Candidatus Dormibacteraeota bacterium]
MTKFICRGCGTQYPDSKVPPEGCATCQDERQYIPAGGQRWTSMVELSAGFRNRLTELEPGLFEIVTEPRFAIGQRALLVRTAAGNVLWDCLSLIDEETVAALGKLGGVQRMAISHPHFYGAFGAWIDALEIPSLLLPAADRAHAVSPHPRVQYFDEDAVTATGDLSVLRLGGHFQGSTVLHWPGGADGRGALLTGDTVAVVADRRHVTFLYSYPNRVPLPAGDVQRIADRCRDLRFDRLYGGFPGDVIDHDARAAVLRSAERYIAMLDGSWPRS